MANIIAAQAGLCNARESRHRGCCGTSGARLSSGFVGRPHPRHAARIREAIGNARGHGGAEVGGPAPRPCAKKTASPAKEPLLRMKLVKSRDLAQRSLGLVAGYVLALKAGTAASPLLLVIRAANELARRILEQPSPVPTPAQRRRLLALAAQLRAMTSRIIVSAEGSDPKSMEGELAELIRRTLELVDRVTAEPPALEPSNIIDVEASES